VLSSVWDPNAHTAQLPVALVNQDPGLHFGTREVGLGAEVLQTLRAQGLFGNREFSDGEDARRGVREGQLALPVVLPPDFSRQAVLASEPSERPQGRAVARPAPRGGRGTRERPFVPRER
jgi:YhgE/Pip-like protein